MPTPAELETVFLVTAAVFVVGTIIPIWAVLKVGPGRHRTWLSGLIAITAVPIFMYAAASQGLGTVEVGGDIFFGTRYVTWLLTTPLLVGYVAYVAGAGRQSIAVLMGADAAMILFGAGAVVASGTLQWALFGLGSLCHLSLLYLMYFQLPKVVPDDPERLGFFVLLKHHIGLLWLAYPFLWVVSPVGLDVITLVGTGLTFAFLDLIAKIPYVYFFYARRGLFQEDGPSPAAGGPEGTVATGD